MSRHLVAAALVATLAGCGGGGSAQSGPTPANTATTPPEGGIDVVGRTHVDGKPCGVAAADGRVWVTDAEGAALVRIDAHGKAERQPAKLDPTPCELTAAFGSLWVVTQSGKLDRVNPSTGKVIARISVGSTSYEAVGAFDSIWVSNRNSGTLSRVDPATNRVVATVRLAGNPGGLVYTAGALWVGDDTSGSSRVFKVDAESGRVRRVRAGHRPGYVAAAGGCVWVSNVEDGTVTQIDASTGKTVRTIEAGASPVNLTGVTGARPEVWVPDDVGNQVIRIDAASGRVVGRVHAEGGPAVVAPAGNAVWVSLFSGEAVLHLRGT